MWIGLQNFSNISKHTFIRIYILSTDLLLHSVIWIRYCLMYNCELYRQCPCKYRASREQQAMGFAREKNFSAKLHKQHGVVLVHSVIPTHLMVTFTSVYYLLKRSSSTKALILIGIDNSRRILLQCTTLKLSCVRNSICSLAFS